MADNCLLKWELFSNKGNLLRDLHITGVHVFNGGRSAFLINQQDKIYAFGAGNSCFEDNLAAPSPKKIKNLPNNGIQALATGQDHAVLLDNSGRVFCWGNNEFGQLGAGNTHAFPSPKQPRLPRIEQISCGHSFTLAVSDQKEVWFWGTQLKDSGMLPIKSMPSQVILSPALYIHSISSGANIATILDCLGKAHTWGHRGCGLDYGYKRGVIIPTRIDFQEKFICLVSCRSRTAFITEDGKFYLSGSSMDGSYFIFTEIKHCGRIASVAGTWHKNLFGITNDDGTVLVLSYEGDSMLTARREFKNILEVFKDMRTPAVIPMVNASRCGIMKFSLKKNNSYENTCQSSGNSETENTGAQLSSAISTLNIFDSNGLIDITDFYDSPVCSDIEIKLSDTSINAHKLVLYSKSMYFKKLIQDNWQDTKMVDMSNWNSGAYKAYIKYLYTGELDIEKVEDVPEIYMLGSQDKNEKIKEACLKIWREKLTEKNVVALYLIAHNCHEQIFMEECGSHLYQILPQLVYSPIYNNLPEPVKLSLALTVAMHRRKSE